jgi:hypothetical protein
VSEGPIVLEELLAPAEVELIVPIAEEAAVTGAVALQMLFDATVGSLLLALAGVFDLMGHVPVVGSHLKFGHIFRELDNSIRHALSQFAASRQEAAGRRWHKLGHLLAHQSSAIWHQGKQTLQTFEWFLADHLPQFVRTHVAPAQKDATSAKTQAKHALKVALETQTALSDARGRPKGADAPAPQKTVTQIQKQVTTIIEVLPVVIGGALVSTKSARKPGTPLVLGKVWTSIHNLQKRVTYLERLNGAKGFRKAMGNALGVEEKCVEGPLRRLTRALCKSGPNGINNILGLIGDLFIITDICEILGPLEKMLGVALGPIEAVVGTAGAALCHGDFDPPPALDAVPVLHVPVPVGLANLHVPVPVSSYRTA